MDNYLANKFLNMTVAEFLWKKYDKAFETVFPGPMPQSTNDFEKQLRMLVFYDALYHSKDDLEWLLSVLCHDRDLPNSLYDSKEDVDELVI